MSGQLLLCIFDLVYLTCWTPSHHNTLDSTDMHVNAKQVLSLLRVLSYWGFQEYPEYKSFDSRSDFVLYTQVPVGPFGNLCPIIDKREILILYSCWQKNDYTMEVSRKN